MAILSLDQLSGYIWINGEFVQWQEAKIHALTHSLHYSGAVFEGERAYNGKIFKLEEHTKRLIESARTVMMEVPYEFDDIIKIHHEVIAKNNIDDAYIRPLIWRGSESLNLTNKILSINMLIAAVPSSSKEATSVNLLLSRWKKPHPDSMPPQCKSAGHYGMMIVAQQEAKAAGFDDALILDWRNYIAECTTTNIFFVQKDKLITPIADTFLNGITRRTVIELAHKLGLKVDEKHLTLETLNKYDECFMTGTAAEIKSVASIDLWDKKIIFKENRITSLLQEEYKALVRS